MYAIRSYYVPGLGRQPDDRRVIQVRRQSQRILFRVPLDLPLLALDVAGVLRLDLDLQLDLLQTAREESLTEIIEFITEGDGDVMPGYGDTRNNFV